MFEMVCGESHVSTTLGCNVYKDRGRMSGFRNMRTSQGSTHASIMLDALLHDWVNR